jgi:hypothetical protein
VESGAPQIRVFLAPGIALVLSLYPLTSSKKGPDLFGGRSDFCDKRVTKVFQTLRCISNPSPPFCTLGYATVPW